MKEIVGKAWNGQDLIHGILAPDSIALDVVHDFSFEHLMKDIIVSDGHEAIFSFQAVSAEFPKGMKEEPSFDTDLRIP